ncbi:hypothetical protein [Micromonospora sp. NPDC049679]|uniref:hypothetical protein n=1 Tax=Micromonospora sp. NPDC049679 TaxID=3155920 RepID=UPI0033D7FE5D
MTFNREIFKQAISEHKNRAVLAVSGLAVFGALAGASPAAAASAQLESPTARTSVSAEQIVAQADAKDKKADAKDKKADAKSEKAGAKDKKAGAKSEKAGAPSVEQLMTNGVPSNQSTYEMTPERMANVKAIIEAGKEMNLPPRAWVIAIATSLQESKLDNLGHLGDMNDHDSLGLFQQRPSSGWGTPEQITDPNYSAKAFYKGLQGVEGYETMPLTVAAQTVQVSAFPDHYAQWEKMAAELVQGTYGHGPYAKIAK